MGSREKVKYRTIIFVGMLLLLTGIWGRAVYRINQKIPRSKQTVFQNAQWVAWKNGIEICVKDGTFMDDQTIRGAENMIEDLLFPGEMRLLWVEVEFRNIGTESAVLDCLELGAETIGWANIPNVELYYALNRNGQSLKIELDRGEKCCYKLPFLMLKENYRGSEWEKAKERAYYITLSLYPVKKMIALPPHFA